MAEAKQKAPTNQRLKQKQHTRMKLMQAAMALFVEQGYEHVTLNEVAKRAGIHEQTLYKHFKTKASLATSYFDLYLDRVLEYFEQQKPGEDVYKSWKRIALNQLELITQDPDNLKVFQMIHANDELLAFTQYRIRTVEDRLCEAFKEQGVYNEFEARLMATQLIGAYRDAHFAWVRSNGQESSIKRIKQFLKLIERQLK